MDETSSRGRVRSPRVHWPHLMYGLTEPIAWSPRWVCIWVDIQTSADNTCECPRPCRGLHAEAGK